MVVDAELSFVEVDEETECGGEGDVPCGAGGGVLHVVEDNLPESDGGGKDGGEVGFAESMRGV